LKAIVSKTSNLADKQISLNIQTEAAYIAEEQSRSRIAENEKGQVINYPNPRYLDRLETSTRTHAMSLCLVIETQSATTGSNWQATTLAK